MTVSYQDTLAALNVSNAHPGGQQMTQLWLDTVRPDSTWSVLDVGCGTGWTACQLREQFGCQVTAVDVRRDMVDRCQNRAQSRGLDIQMEVADIEKLPFKSRQFDLVVCESVLAFVNPVSALREVGRVLRRPGRFVDVEMVLGAPVDAAWRAEVRRVYGAVSVLDKKAWLKQFYAAGFDTVQVIRMQPLHRAMVDMAQIQSGSNQPNSDNAVLTPDILKVVQENGKWMQENAHLMNCAVFCCELSRDAG